MITSSRRTSQVIASSSCSALSASSASSAHRVRLVGLGEELRSKRVGLIGPGTFLYNTSTYHSVDRFEPTTISNIHTLTSLVRLLEGGRRGRKGMKRYSLGDRWLYRCNRKVIGADLADGFGCPKQCIDQLTVAMVEEERTSEGKKGGVLRRSELRLYLESKITQRRGAKVVRTVHFREVGALGGLRSTLCTTRPERCASDLAMTDLAYHRPHSTM